MAGNFFDQFDTPSASPPPAAMPSPDNSGANFFDRFDAAPATMRTQPKKNPKEADPAYAKARAYYDEAHEGYENPVTDFNHQMVANLGVGDELAYGSAYVAQGAKNLFDQYVMHKPIDAPAAVVADAARDSEKERARVYAAEYPGANTGATAAGIAVTGKPTIRPGSLAIMGPVRAPTALTKANALKTGRDVAIANAPLAVARQEGDLADRVTSPGMAIETGTSFLLGSAGQGLSNAVTAKVGSQAAKVAQFEKAGVRPTFAAVGGRGASSVTKAVAENPVAGVRARGALQNSLNDTRDAAHQIASNIGTPGPVQSIGERVQQGVETFANGPAKKAFSGGVKSRFTQALRAPVRDVGSFDAKASAIYEPLWQRFDSIVARRAKAGAPTSATLDATRSALGAITSRVDDPALSALTSSPQIERIAKAVDEAGGQIPLKDLREFRTWVRRAQRDPALRMDADAGALQKIEQALTQDIYKTVQSIAGPSGVKQMRAADTFYAKGSQRIKEALQPFADAGSGEAVYQKIITAARTGAGGDAKKLLNLKLAMDPKDWDDMAATVVANLGNKTKGAADVLEDGAFSVDTFVSNYAALSPQGRKILFGGVGGGGAKASGAHDGLENLARVAGMQKAVEKAANHSNTAVASQSVATLGGLITAPAQTLGVLGGLAVTGEIMTNPAFVKWLASAPAAGATVGGIQKHTALLAQLASKNPALQPIYAQVVKDWTAPLRQKRMAVPEEMTPAQ